MNLNFSLKEVELTDKEKDLIRNAVESYQKDLEDIFKRLKFQRLMETIDLLQDKNESEISKDYIMSKDFPYALTLQFHLIPVDLPAFCGIDGEVKRTLTKEIFLSEKDLELGFNKSNLLLMYNILNQVQEMKWKYFHSVMRRELNGKTLYYIRGCEE